MSGSDSEAAQREREVFLEQDSERQQAALGDELRNKVRESRRLSAVTIYSIIRAEGVEELSRPGASLWWSGIAAGLGISTSVLAEAVLKTELATSPYQALLQSFGYSVGFVLVILSRLQLFTENTLSVVLPLMSSPTRRHLRATARLWGIVLVANMIGTAITAFVTYYAKTAPEPYIEAMLEISRHTAGHSAWEAMVLAVPAGFFVAAIVWMLPSSKGFEIFTIVLFTFLIAAGGFTHVIAGSTKMFLLIAAGEMGVVEAFAGHILPTLVGNVIGGTGLFALLAYAQVHEEV